ncbi:MlaD family protein [Magnetovibrio sp.]|uniref:MlaD family protein n=1 Tax=Magnetovibrio sp. TaxID=2024836 RepID=UPI002F95F5B0
MNTAKINYIAVGLFVTAALIGMVVSIAMLTGRTGATDTYYAVYKNITGVKFGTQVLYEGYPIGQVETVTPVADGGTMLFRVDFEITEGWQIPDDSVARIGASGLLSAITINIDAGTSPIAHKPGSEVGAQEASDLFKVMSGVAGEISNLAENDLRPLLATMNTAVGNFAVTVETVGDLLDEDGQRMIKQFAAVADDLSGLVLDLNDRIPRIAKNVDTSTANFADLSKDLSATRGKLDKLLVTADQLMENSNAMVGENRDEVRKSIEDLKHVTDSLARHIDSVNQNVEGTARNMYEFSREIRQNPGLLLSGTAPQEKGKK